MAADHPTHFHLPPPLPEDLGTARTIMAADRTLMAWIRTGLSMLSFGFTIYKFLETVATQKDLLHPQSPQQIGLFLAGIGTASVAIGTLSYWFTLRELRQQHAFRMFRPALLISGVISLAGVALFVSIATKIV